MTITGLNGCGYDTCPRCGGGLNTYRHPGAKVWCEKCGLVVQDEGPVKVTLLSGSTELRFDNTTPKAHTDRDQEAWDLFAAAALQEIMREDFENKDKYSTSPMSSSYDAAKYADAMMAERAKRMEGTK